MDDLWALISTLRYIQLHDKMMSQEVEFWLCTRQLFVSCDLVIANDNFYDVGGHPVHSKLSPLSIFPVVQRICPCFHFGLSHFQSFLRKNIPKH